METSKTDLSEDELVSYLDHTNIPTVVFEGVEDMAMWRSIEEIVGSMEANFLQCNGRPGLLKIFKKRAKFSKKKVCFVADRDMWIFTGVPDEYADIILTDGYSIENDAYQDGDPERMLKAEERDNHRQMIVELCRWFAFQVEEHLAGREHNASVDLGWLFRGSNICASAALSEIGFCEPNPDLCASITREYKRMLQGKLLFKVLIKFFHAAGRSACQSYEFTVEMASKYGAQGPLLTAMIEKIKAKLASQPTNGRN